MKAFLCSKTYKLFWLFRQTFFRYNTKSVREEKTMVTFMLVFISSYFCHRANMSILMKHEYPPIISLLCGIPLEWGIFLNERDNSTYFQFFKKFFIHLLGVMRCFILIYELSVDVYTYT